MGKRNKKNNNNKNKEFFSGEPSVIEQDGLPENSSEMINYFGTYNIQQTQNSGNTYPAIEQSLSHIEGEKLRKEYERWMTENRF